MILEKKKKKSRGPADEWLKQKKDWRKKAKERLSSIEFNSIQMNNIKVMMINK